MSPDSRIDELRRRVDNDPASIAFAHLAEEYRRAGQLDDAVKTCRRGLALHPGFLSARLTLGRSLHALGYLNEAAAELEAVLAGLPDSVAALRALSDIRRQQGRSAEAARLHEQMLQLAPLDPDLQRIFHDINVRLRPAAPDAGTRVSPVDSRRTIAELERWLEAIHATRAHRRA